MKEATGELNMTLVTILAVAAILTFVTFFVPSILDSIKNKWGNDNEIEINTGYVEVIDNYYA